MDPNELVLELPGGAASLGTALLGIFIHQSAREAELQLLLGWGLGQTMLSSALAASPADDNFVFLRWASLSGNWGKCRASFLAKA